MCVFGLYFQPSTSLNSPIASTLLGGGGRTIFSEVWGLPEIFATELLKDKQKTLLKPACLQSTKISGSCRKLSRVRPWTRALRRYVWPRDPGHPENAGSVFGVHHQHAPRGLRSLDTGFMIRYPETSECWWTQHRWGGEAA